MLVRRSITALRGRAAAFALLLIAGSLLAGLSGTVALAQQADSVRHALSADGEPLKAVLERLAAKTDLALVYRTALVEGQRARCTRSGATAPALLRCVLEGTGLQARRLPSGTFVIEEEAPSDERHTVSGYVEDAETGERLAGAAVYAPDHQVGTTTNRYGFFSLTLPAGYTRLSFSHLGHALASDTLRLRRDTVRRVALVPQALRLEQVEVEGARAAPRLEETSRMSRIEVPVAQLEQLPVLLGETDVFKTLQLLPGVKQGVEGTSGLYVRGGDPGQNLILLDGVPVYNASHLFGFLSVFNTHTLQSVELSKGGFPARYGGRLSSVIDVRMKEGNLHDYRTRGAVGLLSSRITTEGPIIEGKTSYLVSGRRNYIDLVAQPFLPNEGATPTAYFYDLNAKVNHIFSERDRLYLSAYAGRDRFGFEDDDQLASAHLGWGNLTTALRWNHVYSGRLFSNARLTYSQYDFGVRMRAESRGDRSPEKKVFQLDYGSDIRDVSAEVDFEYRPGPRHAVRFGAKGTAHLFQPGAAEFEVTGAAPPDSLNPERIPAQEGQLYVEDDARLTERLKVNVGLHASAFHVEGRTYAALQPRLSARYLLPGGWGLKGSFASMRQYVHLLTHSGVGLPTDLWVPATDRLRPQRAWQAGVGISRTTGPYEMRAEGYYKAMQNVIAYEPGASYTNTGSFEEKVATGHGWSYGAELFVQKKTGRTTGWLGYTLSWAGRQFDTINDGDAFPHRYDRRHSLSAVVTHRLSERFDLSGTWVYRTGRAETLPKAVYRATNKPYDFIGSRTVYGVHHYGERNGFRMPAYHRLDLGVDWHLSRAYPDEGDHSAHTLSFGFYNAYSHENVSFIHSIKRENGKAIARGLALLPALPYVNYEFSF